MTDEQLRSYTKRITNASKSELVVITYELIINDLKDAIDSYEKGNREYYNKYLRNGKGLLKELITSLDYRYKISYELVNLYLTVDKYLVDGIFKKDIDKVKGAMDVMFILQKSFIELAKTDTSGPVMMNAEQIYAGLTYGKGTLNEVTLDSNYRNRGFKA